MMNNLQREMNANNEYSSRSPDERLADNRSVKKPACNKKDDPF